jgi:hypothetical protein
VSGVEFLDPQPANVPVFPDFSAYGDELFAKSRSAVLETIQPNERFALAWAKRHLSAGAPVVELFAESGRFAWLLRDAGFRVHVADPLASHAAMLGRHGLPSVQALCPDSTTAWPEPAAVFVLESIVRLPRPRAFVEQVRTRFPGAKIFLTAPSPHRPLKLPLINNRGGYPPDFMTRWSAPALGALLKHAGYETVVEAAITPMLTRLTSRTRPKRLLFNFGWSTLLRLAGEYEFSVSAWSAPRT